MFLLFLMIAQVLRCVSNLDVAQVLGSSHDQGRKKLPDILAETASQSLVVSADMIFERSKSLNGEAIVCFVRWLCNVSLEELKHKPPRDYCLKKIVDVAYYNMERIRLEYASFVRYTSGLLSLFLKEYTRMQYTRSLDLDLI